MPSTCHTPPMPAYRVPETRRGLTISLPSDWQERHLTGPPSALPVSAIHQTIGSCSVGAQTRGLVVIEKGVGPFMWRDPLPPEMVAVRAVKHVAAAA